MKFENRGIKERYQGSSHVSGGMTSATVAYLVIRCWTH